MIPNTHDAGQIFPTFEKAGEVAVSLGGLSLRAYIATHIAAGLCSNSGGPFQANQMNGWGIVNSEPNDIARVSVDLADALIAELDARRLGRPLTPEAFDAATFFKPKGGE